MRLSRLSLILCLSTLAACGAPTPEDAANSSEPAIGSNRSAEVVTCANPKSCGSWSAWYNIGAPFCVASTPDCETEVCHPCHCTQDDCDTCCTVRLINGQYQKQESFRDCTLQNGSACRAKRERQVLLSCGGPC